MATFLESVVERTRDEVSRRKRELPPEQLAERLGPARRGRPFSEALIDEGISLIAEMKRASPSRGPIRPGASVSEIVRAYEAGGARAVSVLTEREHFGGSLDDLVVARSACDLPLLRKDFLVDEYQLLEARVAGADAALLIVGALPSDRLAAMMGAAAELGMDALVEVHDERDLEAALEAGAEVIGINNRDLHSLEVDVRTTFRLLADVPAGTVVVAESGITGPEDVRELEEAGVDAILVGEALMRAEDPAEAVRALLGASAERRA
ncbi:MAG: indole-3-glycerol phosphate synthase TrpC [Thermoleophilia bacterium]|nr:indole-3-glycerol phosphate synthase TrpC [Thermoleophilia bacterium]